jgi:hypothetical protein
VVAWTNATPRTASDAGVLRPDKALRHFALDRPRSHPDLDPWVERYWTVRWSLPAGTSYDSSVLTHPAVHLTVESGATCSTSATWPSGSWRRMMTVTGCS